MKGDSKRFIQGKSSIGKDIPYVIYMISNLVDGKLYIGSSINYKNRWSHHLNLLRSNKHHNKHLQRAFNVYGEHSFIFTIIVSVFSKDKVRELEQTYLDIYFDIFKNKIYNNSRIVVGGYCAPDIRGELNPKAKLSKDAIKQIRSKFNEINGKYGDRYLFLSKEYLVSPLTISRIIRNKSWKDD